MEAKKFSERYEQMKGIIREGKENGFSETVLLRGIIASITWGAGEPDEESYSESQLKALFDLIEGKNDGQNDQEES